MLGLFNNKNSSIEEIPIEQLLIGENGQSIIDQ